jgi:hypothetical protein
LIALDHADLSDPWFQGSVIERWREGEALIPQDWLTEDAGGDAPGLGEPPDGSGNIG